jgi:hypothetical protein
MKVGDQLIVRNNKGGHEFKVGECVMLTKDLGNDIFYASNGRMSWAVNPENFDVMIELPKLRAFVVKQMSPNFGRITDQSNGKRTAFAIYNDEMMNNASKILSGRGINIVSYSSLTKGRGVLLSDDMDTPILNV